MGKRFSEANSNRQIKAGAIMSYLSIAVNMVAGLIYTPWMIKEIGQSNYGLFTLASSLISMFMVDFGISSAVAKYLSQYLAEDNSKAIDNFLGIVYKLYLLIDAAILCIFIVVYINLSSIYANLSVEEISTFRVIFLIIAGYNIIAFPFIPLSGVLTAYEKFFKLKLCNIVNKVGTVISTIIALWLGKGIFALVFINVFWNFLILCYKFIIVKTETPTKANLSFWDNDQLKKVFSFSVWATIISIMSRLVFNVMPSILASLSGATSVALFGLASTLEGYVYTFSEAINGMFLPKTVRASYSKNRDNDMLELMIKVGRINLSIVALIVIGFGTAGREFVRLWLGEGYDMVYICAMLMILPDIIYCPQQIGRTALIAEDKIKYQAFIYMAVCLLNVLVAVVLCPNLGVLGGGIAIGITYSFRLVLMTIVFHKKLKLNMLSFFYHCHIKMIAPIIITVVVGTALFKVYEVHLWIVFLVKCAVVTSVYICSMWLLAWNVSEKRLIMGFAKISKK